MCLSVTLHIVGLWKYCVCCTRSGLTRYTLFMELYLCQWEVHAVLWRTLVHLCASSLQNLAVPNSFYSLVSISVERSGDSVFDGVGLAGFKSSRANAFLLSLSITQTSNTHRTELIENFLMVDQRLHWNQLRRWHKGKKLWDCKDWLRSQESKQITHDYNHRILTFHSLFLWLKFVKISDPHCCD